MTTPPGPPPESDRPDVGRPGQQHPGPQYPGPQHPGPQYPQSPGYPPPGGQYGQPYGGYAEPPRSNGLGIAALVLGILSLPGAFFVGVPGIVLGLIAVVLGIVALRRVRARRADNRGMAITGLVTGALGLLLGIVVLAGAVLLVRTTGDCIAELDRTGDQARYEQCLQESVED